MITELISGENNYFNIVNIDGIKEDLNKRGSESEAQSSSPTNYGVNSSVFDYFVQRKMFDNGNDKN